MRNFELFVTRSATDPAAPPSAGVAVSSTNTYYSGLISESMGQGLLSLQLAWSGTPTGAFTLWASNKAEPALATDADWTAVTWTSSDPGGSAGGQRADFVDQPYRWARVKYVNASGSGTITGRATVL